MAPWLSTPHWTTKRLVLGVLEVRKRKEGLGSVAPGQIGTERSPDLKWLLHPNYLPPQKPVPHSKKGLLPPLLQGAQSTAWRKIPHCGGRGVTEKIRDSHLFSQTHSCPALSQTKTHTQSPSHHPWATCCRSLHLWASTNLLGREDNDDFTWELSRALWGGVYYYSKDQGSKKPQVHSFCGGDSPPSSLFRGIRCSATTPRWGQGAAPKPQGWGVGWGRTRRRGRLLQARHKETSFSLCSMATLGRGQCAPILPSPPAGLGTSAATHLLPITKAWLTWAGASRTPRQGAWAPSRFLSAWPGGLRAPQPWAGMRRAPRGAQSPWSSSFERVLLLVRDISCCLQVPRIGGSRTH